MAKEKKSFIQNQDFLGDLMKDVSKSTGSGLYEKLSANARQQALQPLVGLSNIKKAVAPLIELKDKAEAAQKAGMAAYIAANPEIDESLLYDGTGDLVNDVMQQNNLRFREINQQLSFMDIRNPRYQELANELNQINATSAQLREDNKKLLGIRNIMKDDNRVEELTEGMTKSERDMYEDILSGNKNNFVNVNGKLHWQDPNNPQEDPIAISSLDAGGPMYTNSVVMEKHIGLYNEVINAQFVDDAVLYSKINSLWKNDGVGNAGLKSFIFDNRDADDAMGFDTNDWFNSWYEANGIAEDDEDAKMAEYERIRSVGVTADALVEGLPGVKKHFTKWYHNEMKKNVASQYNKKQETKNENPLDPKVGCTDPKATNYKADATIDDGSCSYDKKGDKQKVYDTLFDYDDQMNDKKVVTRLNRNREIIGMPEGVTANATTFDGKEIIYLDGFEGLVSGIDKKYFEIPIGSYVRRDGKFVGTAGIAIDNIFSVYNTMIQSDVEMTGENFDKLYTETYGQFNI